MNERMMANSVPCRNQIDISDMLLIVGSLNNSNNKDNNDNNNYRKSISNYIYQW